MLPDRWITDWAPSARYPHYTRANAGEVLPDPATPLGWTFVWDHGIVPGWGDGYAEWGVFDRSELDPVKPETVGSFGGYMYINLTTVRLQGVRTPGGSVEVIDQVFFGSHPDVPTYVPHPDDERLDITERLGPRLQWALSLTDYPELRDDRDLADQARASRPDLAVLSDADLVARARSYQPLLSHMFQRHTMTSVGSAVGPGVLGALAQQLGDPSMSVRLIAGIGDVDSAAPSYAMWELSRLVRSDPAVTAAFDAGLEGLVGRVEGTPFAAAFTQFLARFGSRGPNEWEICTHSWETRPEIALASIERMRLVPDQDAPALRNEKLVADREALTAQLRSQLAGQPEVAGMLEAGLQASKVFLAGRERSKTNIIKVIGEVRMCFHELARRLVERGVIDDPRLLFMLLDSEVDAFVAAPSAVVPTLRERFAQWSELWELDPPFIIDGVAPPLSQWRRRGSGSVVPAASGEVLGGLAGSPGTATGVARIVHDPSDIGALEPGDVLVAPLTDPAWTPLFVTAGAVVVDVGAPASHAVIVSRELGLPCVVSVTDATRRIQDGATVTVDGTNGTVTIH